MPPGLGRVGIAVLGAVALAVGAVAALSTLVVGLLFLAGGAALLLWSIRRP